MSIIKNVGYVYKIIFRFRLILNCTQKLVGCRFEHPCPYLLDTSFTICYNLQTIGQPPDSFFCNLLSFLFELVNFKILQTFCCYYDFFLKSLSIFVVLVIKYLLTFLFVCYALLYKDCPDCRVQI